MSYYNKSFIPEKYAGICSVAGGFLFFFSFGHFHTIANIVPYVNSILKIQSGQDIWISAVTFSIIGICMPIGGFVASKLGFRLVLIMSTILTTSGILLSSLTIKHSLALYILTYCVVFGMGVGLPFSVILSMTSSWFPKHTSAIIGLITSGFGFGGLFFTPIQTAFINPDDSLLNIKTRYFGNAVIERIPSAFLKIGTIIFVMEFIGLLLIQEKRYEIEEEINETKSFLLQENKNEPKPFTDFTVIEALKCVDFYILLAVFCVNIVPTVFMSATYKIFGEDSGAYDHYLTYVSMFSGLFLSVGKLCWGLAMDKLSYKLPLGVMQILWASFLLSFPMINSVNLHMVVYKYLFPIWIFIIHFIMSGNQVIIPGATTIIFGQTNMPIIYGIIYCSGGPSALISAAISSRFKMAGHWFEIYASCALLCLLSFGLSLILKNNNSHILCTEECCKGCDPFRKRVIDNDTDIDKN